MKIIGLCHPSFFILDHLAPLSHYWGIPLVCFDPKILEIAKKHYPNLNISYQENLEESIFQFLQEYDLILHSMLSWSSFAISLNKMLNTDCRIAYVPHGNSDKKAVMQDPCLKHDIFFVYGDHMLDLLKDKILKEDIASLVHLDNLRYRYYLEHQEFFDALAKEKIGPHQDKKTILYAPSWDSQGSEPAFFEEAEKLSQGLSSSFNLLIKPHPSLEEKYPVEYFLLKERCEEKGAVFIEEFPHIYSLLHQVDILIADTSSIAYDFLIFDRPIYLLASAEKTLLEKCSLRLPKEVDRLLAFLMDKNPKDLSSERKELYLYCFSSASSLLNTNSLQMEKIL